MTDLMKMEMERRSKDYFPVFTIGHSLHDIEWFSSLLERFQIQLILDVRSSPFSRRAPQFDKPQFNEWLETKQIRYSFAGRHMGGRPDDPEMYVGGQVSYQRMASDKHFVSSLRRVVVTARRERLAILCAEGDPIECHRFLLISRALKNSVEIHHILPTGEIESQIEAEQRMIERSGLHQVDVFRLRSDVLHEAYAIQEERYAYCRANTSAFSREGP